MRRSEDGTTVFRSTPPECDDGQAEKQPPAAFAGAARQHATAAAVVLVVATGTARSRGGARPGARAPAHARTARTTGTRRLRAAHRIAERLPATLVALQVDRTGRVGHH